MVSWPDIETARQARIDEKEEVLREMFSWRSLFLVYLPWLSFIGLAVYGAVRLIGDAWSLLT